MKRSHRTTHRILWLMLVPLLLFFVFLAQNSGPTKAPLIDAAPHVSTPHPSTPHPSAPHPSAPHPSAVGELP
ncbi:MAG: hypothetical protein ACJAUP_000866 [Cellvibrionaceae bacterium]|jgi:hypothetical protein